MPISRVVKYYVYPTHEGDVVKTYVLDRPIAGIYVDEAAGMLFGLDVNADEQIVKFPLELE